MIVFTDVSKKYPLGNVALEAATFTIKDNEFVFLVGPSGAGKTTILKLIMRDLEPTTGIIKVDDYDLTQKKFNEKEKLRRTIGMVFQDFKILPDKNVAENIVLSMKVVGLPVLTMREELKKALELVGLEKKARVFPVQLSAGELQRVAIARAIVGNRHIILADEPTGNLDPKTTWEIMRIFRKLEGKKTIIIATHNTDVVNSMEKRVIILKEGKITKDSQKGGYEL